MSANMPGLTHNALLQCEIFRECYAKGAPLDDYLKIAYRSSQLVSYFHLLQVVTLVNSIAIAWRWT